MQYPKDFVNKLVQGDCLKLLKYLPDASVNIVVTSPPYNLRNSTGNWAKSKRPCRRWKNSALRVAGYDGHTDNMPHKEYVQWQRTILGELMRVVRDDGVIFYNHKWRVQGGLWQNRQDILDGFPVRQVIVWRRKGGINFNPGYFVPTYEVIYLIAKPAFKLNHRANRIGDVWEITQERNNPHPAPFPVELPSRCIQSCPGEVVLDPFMGSGTTAIAAMRLNRSFIGFDLSPDYCEMARKRILLEAKNAEPRAIEALSA